MAKNLWYELSISKPSLPTKMRPLRHRLNVWNKETFGNIDFQISSLKKSLDIWETITEQRIISAFEEELIQQIKSDLSSWISMNESL